MAELIGKLSARSAILRPDDITIDGEATSSLGFKHISQEEYHDLVVNDKILSNVVYVVSSDYLNMYDEQIKNLAPGTDPKDAINVSQLSSASKELSDAMASGFKNLSSTMTCADAFLSNAISTKIYVGGISGLSTVDSLSIQQVSHDYYHDLVLNGEANPKTVYIVSSDTLNMYDEKIINLKDGEDKQDATTVGQVQLSIDNAKSELSSALSSTKLELQNADGFLSNAIDSKIYVDARNGSLSSTKSLSIKYIAQSAYHELVVNNEAVSNCIYIVSNDVLDMYGEKIVNLLSGVEDKDGVNVGQLKLSGDAWLAQMDASDARLEKKIDSKIWINSTSADALSICSISQDKYHEKVLDGSIDANTLYVVSADHLNMYGEQIKNLKDGTDAKDATTLSQLESKTKSVFDVKNALLSYINTASTSAYFESNKLKNTAPTSCLVELVNIIVENIIK